MSTRLLELEDKAERIRADLGVLRGSIRLGILNDFSAYLSADIVTGFRHAHPKVTFQVFSCSMEEMEDRLMEGTLDFALTAMYKNRAALEIKPYIAFEREPMASPSYLKTVPQISRYEDLLNMDLLGLGERLGSLRYWFRKNGLKYLEPVVDKIEPVVIADDIRDFNNLIIQGAGIGLCYRVLVQTELNRRQLVSLFPNANPVVITLDISRRKVHSSSLLMGTFWAYMTREKD